METRELRITVESDGLETSSPKPAKSSASAADWPTLLDTKYSDAAETYRMIHGLKDGTVIKVTISQDGGAAVARDFVVENRGVTPVVLG
jgi:hypothetical protein